MKGLPLKSSIKLGLKKTWKNILPAIISVLLCAACAMLFAYAEMFWQYDRYVVEARAVKNLNEDDYKYERFYCDYGTSVSPAADYLCKNYSALKYIGFIETDASSMVSDGLSDFFMINSYDDIISFGYTFYGDYDKTLSECSAYVSDSYLKNGKYYFYENGEWELQDYSGNADTSDEWFSSFVGKSIYPESYDELKIEIAGVVNTGYYELSFRDLGLEGEDEYGDSVNDYRNKHFYSSEKSEIGGGFFCTESFARSYAVKSGLTRVGARYYNYGFCVDDGRDVSFTAECGTTSFSCDGEDVVVLNAPFIINEDNRSLKVSYANDEKKANYNLGDDEIIITMELYKDIFDEKYNYERDLPAYVGEKISLNITVDGETYEIKDKIFAGVYDPTRNYYGDSVDEAYGIICPNDKVVNELIADCATANYMAVVDICKLSESELAVLLRTMEEEYNCQLSTFARNAAMYEAESISSVKNVYMIIAVVLFVLSLLFGAWNVLHTIKRDYREIGILRANGVTAKDMSIIYAVQFIICGILSFILSLIGVNILIDNYIPSDHNVINYMLYFPEIELYWIGPMQVISLIAINLIVPLIISIFAFFRVHKISPVAAINEAKRNE